MDILLINPAKRDKSYLTEHLGIACLKAYAETNGFQADTYDMAIEDSNIADAVQIVLRENPLSVGISLLDATKKRGLALICALRNAGYSGYIIIGGYFATFCARQVITDFNQIDFVVRGEGEATLVELLAYIRDPHQKDLKAIQGISYREQEQIIENPARPLLGDLQQLPFIDRKYAQKVLANGSNIRIYASRGCWGSCTFCDIIGLYGTSAGKMWRRRPVGHLLDEIEQLMQRFGTDYFIFNDDQFLVKGARALKYIEEFVAAVRQRKLKFRFELMCRADTVSPKVMKLLRRIGLQRIFLGLESFDPAQLDRYGKKISVRQNLKAIITLYQLKIDVIASVILADAYTSLGDLLRQFVLLTDLRRRYFNSKRCRISINKKLEIYPGTAVYQKYKSAGILTKDDYLEGYDYNLRMLTSLRLGILHIEEKFWSVTGNLIKRLAPMFASKY